MEVLLPPDDPAWRLDEPVYQPRYEAAAESRFSVSNGFLGVRGSREASRGPTWAAWLHNFSWSSWPRTFVAGLFDIPNFTPPVPALVPVADWMRVRIHLDGALLRLDHGTLLGHSRTLDYRRGLLLTDWRQRTVAGVVARVRTLRLVSQADRAIGLQMLHFELESGAAAVTLEAAFDHSVSGLEAVRLDADMGLWRTEQTGQELAIACAADLARGGHDAPPGATAPLAWTWGWTGQAGGSATLRRMIGVARGASPQAAARAALDRAYGIGWRAVLDSHAAAWAQRWQAADVEITGDPAAQQALRFAVYHMTSAANPDDEHVSIGARALTGDGYLGHVFWDTESYLLPFYTVAWPAAARALLMYRYHSLDGARAKAAKLGWRGAMYAWESADTGAETTPDQVLDPLGRLVDVLTGKLEQHITADVSYAVWQYWQISGDAAFQRDAGAEILIETARFWASRALPGPDGLRHIRNVIGPDEFHEGVDDNVYTNRLAAWSLRRAVEAEAWLRQNWPDHAAALAARLQLSADESTVWAAAADAMAPGVTSASGILEQFEGYFALEDIDPAPFAARQGGIDMVLGHARVQGSQLLKQADVVALLGLLPDMLPPAAAKANFDYYAARCTHDSSLSRPMHALVAARLGETETALRFFREGAGTDLAATPEPAAAGGVRMATLGGLWQAAVFGFAGVSFNADGITLAPQLPPDWQTMTFRLHWQGRRVLVRLSQTGVQATLEHGDALTLRVGGAAVVLGGLGAVVAIPQTP